MPKWTVVVLSVFAVVGVLYSALLLIMWLGPPAASCTVYPVMSVPSTSGRLQAEVRNEICESKQRYETIVWLSDGTSVNLGGKTWSAFIAPSAQNAPLGSYTPLSLQLKWLSDTELQISYPAGTKLLSSAGTKYDVTVTYVERIAP